MVVFEVPEIVTAHYEDSLRAMRMEWRTFKDSTAFRDAMERGIREGSRRGIVAWIADTRQTQGILSPEDQQYIADLLPVARSTGLRAIITIRPASALTAMSARRWQRAFVDARWNIVEVDSLDEARDYCRHLQATIS